MSLFSDARIVKEYVTKTLNTLTLSEDRSSLILKYVRCCKPALTDLEDMTKYCLASAEKNFLDAWEYQRQFTDKSETRQHLLHKLFQWVCTRKSLKTFSLPQHLRITYSYSPAQSNTKFTRDTSFHFRRVYIARLRYQASTRVTTSGCLLTTGSFLRPADSEL